MACRFLQAFYFMNNTIKIDIPVASTEQSEILIATLSEMDFYAFQEDQNILSAYIKEEIYEEDLLKSNFPWHL